jgi:shikimate dehydrogenase
MHWSEVVPDQNAGIRIAAVSQGVDMTYVQAVTLAAFASSGARAQFLSFDLPRTEFDACIQHLKDSGFRGVLVSNPFKVDAARLAERFWVSKFALGVANSLLLDKGIFAQNSEVPAITSCVSAVERGTALVMGTGHAARSVITGLLDANFQIKLWNRNVNKTKILKSLLERYGDITLATSPDPSGCKLVVNATPLGTKLGECPPVLWERMLPRTVCFDLVFRRVPTDFLRNAASRGLKTIDGRELLVEQSGLCLEWFLGTRINREPMRLAAGLKVATPL